MYPHPKRLDDREDSFYQELLLDADIWIEPTGEIPFADYGSQPGCKLFEINIDVDDLFGLKRNQPVQCLFPFMKESLAVRYDVHMRSAGIHWVGSRLADPTVNRPVFQEFLLGDTLRDHETGRTLPSKRVDQFFELMQELSPHDKERIHFDDSQKQFYHAERFNQILYTSQRTQNGLFFNSLSMELPDRSHYEIKLWAHPMNDQLSCEFISNYERTMKPKELAFLLKTFDAAYDKTYTQSKIDLFKQAYALSNHGREMRKIVSSRPINRLFLYPELDQPRIK